MVWVRLADDFTDHPKVVSAGPLASWLYVCGLTYANRYLTDGFVPSGQVRRMADVDDAMALAAKLVQVGLWEPVEGGYRIHDYHGYQPSADDVKREREETARRQAEYRSRRRNGSSNAVTNGERLGAPYPARPVPGPVNPDPAVTSPPTPSPHGGKGGAADAAEEKPGRRRRVRQVEPTGGEAPPSETTAPVSDGDRLVLDRARAALSVELNPGNAEQLGQLVPIGRAADGGLHLRAPPGLHLSRFAPVVRRALLDAGDQHAALAVIVEARPGESES